MSMAHHSVSLAHTVTTCPTDPPERVAIGTAARTVPVGRCAVRSNGEPTMTPQPESAQGGHDYETASNPERGCGYLEEGKAYLRASMSALGTLPAFVEFEDPLPFLEGQIRGYARFPGVQFELEATPSPEDYYPSDAEADIEMADAVHMAKEPAAVRTHPEALDTLREEGLGDAATYRTRTDPPLEAHRHIERLKGDTAAADSPAPENVGSMRSARSHDLLMWVGETYYETADEYIEETRSLGLSKAIPTSKNQEPPVINPGRTRVFLIHPRAINTGPDARSEGDEDQYIPGIIGYSYVTEVVYTGITQSDGSVDFPAWAHEFADAGKLDLVQVGAREPRERRENGSTIEDFVNPEDSEAPAPYFEDHDEDDGYLAANPESDSDDGEAADSGAESEESDEGDGTSPEDDAEPVDTSVDEEAIRDALGGVPAQKLRSKLSDNGIETGAHPSKDDLIDLIIEHGLASVVSASLGGDDE